MAAIVAAATPPPPPQKMSVNSRKKRLGGVALFYAIVVCRASLPREELDRERRTAVVEKASALLQSIRRTSVRTSELLSV